METIKPECIVLSDLWGKRKAFPLNSHKQLLEAHFRVHYFDSTLLAEIPPIITTQDELHQAFVQGGLTKAVENLSKQKINASCIIGYSVGGVIAWHYVIQQPKVTSLLAISATRLRYENIKPACSIQLFYGEQDPYQPTQEWYEQLGLNRQIIPLYGHDIYRIDNLKKILYHDFIRHVK
ncbi:MAG: hypothetical protein AAGJ93_01865 [Bacteroidota bacterium]